MVDSSAKASTRGSAPPSSKVCGKTRTSWTLTRSAMAFRSSPRTVTWKVGMTASLDWCGDTEPRDVDPLKPERRALAADQPSPTNDSSAPRDLQVMSLSQQGIQMHNYTHLYTSNPADGARAAGAHHVQDRVHDHPPRMLLRPATRVHPGQQRLD